MLQMAFNRNHKKSRRSSPCQGRRKLCELRIGEQGILESIDLPGPAGRRLMELGFLPGSLVTAACQAPGGDPLVFGVDGSQVALRRETAAFLTIRGEAPAGD